jgi:hypothetical protein
VPKEEINAQRGTGFAFLLIRSARMVSRRISLSSSEKGSFEILDCVNQKRTADTKFVPVMAFKNGRRIDCDVALAQDERNWFMSIAKDHVPETAKTCPPHRSNP